MKSPYDEQENNLAAAHEHIDQLRSLIDTVKYVTPETALKSFIASGDVQRLRAEYQALMVELSSAVLAIESEWEDID